MHRKQLDQILMLSREKDIQSLPPIHALVPSMWTWGPFHREYTTVGCPRWPNQLSGKQIQSSFKKVGLIENHLWLRFTLLSFKLQSLQF